MLIRRFNSNLQFSYGELISWLKGTCQKRFENYRHTLNEYQYTVRKS